MPEFHSSPGGAILELDADESALLRGLVAELRSVIVRRPEGTGPVTDRLFPDAYDRPDDQLAYDELTRDALQTHKLRALDAISLALHEGRNLVELTGEELELWLAGLTDLRLAIGTRLGVDEERMSAEVDPADPDAYPMAVLHWLGWLQEGLLRSLDVRGL